MTPFDFVADISTKKTNLLSNLEDDPQVIKDYVPFIINKAFGYWIDTILFAEDMNRLSHLSNQMQHDFLFHSIKKKFRKFQKWHKVVKNENVELLQLYYKINSQKAIDALSILTDDDIEDIRQKLDKGGKV